MLTFGSLFSGIGGLFEQWILAEAGICSPEL